MTRSPLFYPLNRGMDADAGGAADLQTDVMRFMAIIAMCLVAIFALVQSIPLAPTPVPVVMPPAPLAPVPEVESRDAVKPEPEPELELVRPAPKSIVKKAETVVLQRPVPRPIPRPSPAEPQQEPAAAAVTESNTPATSPPRQTQKGFTLRFESDEALNRLVARDVVGLYAIGQDRAQRMSIESGNMSFWTASTPDKVHEMDVATVPADVLAAWRRNNAATGTNIKWGVAIPPSMSRQLGQYLAEHAGGSLIIGADGALRLEQ